NGVPGPAPTTPAANGFMSRTVGCGRSAGPKCGSRSTAAGPVAGAVAHRSWRRGSAPSPTQGHCRRTRGPVLDPRIPHIDRRGKAGGTSALDGRHVIGDFDRVIIDILVDYIAARASSGIGHGWPVGAIPAGRSRALFGMDHVRGFAASCWRTPNK